MLKNKKGDEFEYMNINIDDLKEIYGDEIVEILNNNIDIIDANVKTMKELGFKDVEGILEREIDIFLSFPNSFKQKINNLIKNIGLNYVEVIEKDVSYLEKM